MCSLIIGIICIMTQWDVLFSFIYIYKSKILYVGKFWGRNFSIDYVTLGIWMYHFYFQFFFMVSSVSNEVIFTLIFDYVCFYLAFKSCSYLLQWLQECVKGWLSFHIRNALVSPFYQILEFWRWERLYFLFYTGICFYLLFFCSFN